MDIKKAQTLVDHHLEEIGYKKIETTTEQAFIHLIEETGEVARAILHKQTKRNKLATTTDPSNLKDEVADIFWQTLKLAIYLDIDLDAAFKNKYRKNRNKMKNNNK
ncbi:MAG: MazG nucleotide pyrophosphohydrolase domain-containing protein [Patescibacteria group bacterium]|jgi:NTP pyrophosphatase (non-canonical NTP hydrolase)